MTIEELLRDAGRREFAAVPEADALTDEDALQEAYLVNMRVDVVSGQAWLLFDCRGALQIEMGNTAVLVVRGLRSVSWDGEKYRQHRTQRSIVAWSPSSSGDGWQVEAGTEPSGRLVLAGVEAEFFVGDVPGGDDPPPNFIDATDEELRAGLPDWSSDFDPVHASFSSSHEVDLSQ